MEEVAKRNSNASGDCIKVALRVRPLVRSKEESGCWSIVHKTRNSAQVVLNNTDQFTFNFAFSPDETQEMFYEKAIKPLVQTLINGYNVTILAYGQTGSGKTHTMGTAAFYEQPDNKDIGLIPRAISDIFKHVSNSSETHMFEITCSFVEIYQEVVYDLLSQYNREQSIVDIREDFTKHIFIAGLTEKTVNSSGEAFDCLIQGVIRRAVDVSAMNHKSSRSHAIFTVTVRKTCIADPDNFTLSKLHLVDLAGSERSNKTQAMGQRFKENVKINQGLFALRNVISALGRGHNGHISYRDSKLTRLLQDALGGNSVTLMIACVSPAEFNMDETLKTLRYADLAKHIRNTAVVVTVDRKTEENKRLKAENQELLLKLLEYQRSRGQSIDQFRAKYYAAELVNVQLLTTMKHLTTKVDNLKADIAPDNCPAEFASQAQSIVDLKQLFLKATDAAQTHLGVDPNCQEALNEIQKQYTPFEESLQKKLVSYESKIKEMNARMSRVKQIAEETLNSKLILAKLAEELRKKVLQLEAEIKTEKNKSQNQDIILKQQEQKLVEIKKCKVELIQLIKQIKIMYLNRGEEHMKSLLDAKNKSRLIETNLRKENIATSLVNTVLKCKLDESSVTSKRLIECMKNHYFDKQQWQTSASPIKTKNHNAYIKCVIDTIYTLVDAKQSLMRISLDRAQLSTRLVKIKRKLHPNEEDQSEMDTLKQEIAIHNANIGELQGEIKLTDLDDMLVNAVDGLSSMSEARSAVKLLLETLVDQRILFGDTLEDAHQLPDNVRVTSDKLRQQIMELRQEFHQLRISKESILLKELNSFMNSVQTDGQRTDKDMLKEMQTKLNACNLRIQQIEQYQSRTSDSEGYNDEYYKKNDPDWAKTPPIVSRPVGRRYSTSDTPEARNEKFLNSLNRHGYTPYPNKIKKMQALPD